MRLQTLSTTDPRLGRHVEHDPRSIAYGYRVIPKSVIKTVIWDRRAPVTDQGDLGSCTGHALAGYLATDSANMPGRSAVQVVTPYGPLNAQAYPVDGFLAEALYSVNTVVDGFPGTWRPTDTGSSGLAGCKTLQTLGLSDVYQHAFSLDALKSAIQAGPVMLGTVWLNSMMEPNADGRIPVLTRSGQAGGHEILISGYETPTSRDLGRFWLTNSWGTSWGQSGLGYVTDTDMSWLLSQDGDLSIPHLTAPAVPPGPNPTPIPTPPAPEDADRRLWSQMQNWAMTKGFTGIPA